MFTCNTIYVKSLVCSTRTDTLHRSASDWPKFHSFHSCVMYFVNFWSWISVKLLSVKLIFWWQIWIGQTNLEIVSSETILRLNSISYRRGRTQVWTVNLIYGGLRNNFSKYLLNICMWADLNLIFSEQFRGLLFCKCCRTSFIQFAVNQSAIRFLPKL